VRRLLNGLVALRVPAVGTFGAYAVIYSNLTAEKAFFSLSLFNLLVSPSARPLVFARFRVCYGCVEWHV
jgi:hypothetical protein